MKIIFTGGGTGGHLFPIIAISREIRRLYTGEDLKLYYIGPYDPVGMLQLSQEPLFKIHTIPAGKLRRYFSLQNILDVFFKIPWGFIQSFFLLLAIRPNLVFSKGGTASLPVTVSAWLLGIPVFLHESDIMPGLSNRVTSAFAKKIFISFSKTAYFNPGRTILVGNPIKKELLEGDSVVAKELFSLESQKPVILFLGGSQGAGPLNDFITMTRDALIKNYEIIHVCGKKNYRALKLELSAITGQDSVLGYHLYDSLDEVRLKHAYAVATLIISRAGAASIFEIAAVGKPSILVPLPNAAGDHQSKNAYEYAASGAALVVEQQNLTPNFFLSTLEHLLASPEKLETMKQAALAFAKPLAAKAIAREILEYLQK